MIANIPDISPHPANASIRKIGVSVPALARLLNVSTSHLYSVLNGTQAPSETLENRITAYINRSTQEIRI